MQDDSRPFLLLLSWQLFLCLDGIVLRTLLSCLAVLACISQAKASKYIRIWKEIVSAPWAAFLNRFEIVFYGWMGISHLGVSSSASHCLYGGA